MYNFFDFGWKWLKYDNLTFHVKSTLPVTKIMPNAYVH